MKVCVSDYLAELFMVEENRDTTLVKEIDVAVQTINMQQNNARTGAKADENAKVYSYITTTTTTIPTTRYNQASAIEGHQSRFLGPLCFHI